MTSASTAPSVADLAAQRDRLEAQLAAMGGARADARQALLNAERSLVQVEHELATTGASLDAANASVRALSVRIAADELGLEAARSELGGLLHADYVATGSDGFAGAILDSTTFTDAIDRVRSAQRVTARVVELQSVVLQKESDLLHERGDLEKRAAAASALETQLGEENGRMLAAVAQRDLAFHDVDGAARVLAAQIASIDDQIANAGGVAPTGSCGNRFAFGYCTWYVATRRCIPWLGNAWEWWGNARLAGYSEGNTPARGAVVVWGMSGSSPIGHVAYVEAVGPTADVPAGYFLVSEMNYAGWDRVDYRKVSVTAPGILGFIYGRA